MQAAALNDGVNLSGLTATPSHSCACSTAPTTTLACSTALGTCASPAIVLEYVQVNTSSTIHAAFPLARAADYIYCERLCAHAGCAAMTRLIGRRSASPCRQAKQFRLAWRAGRLHRSSSPWGAPFYSWWCSVSSPCASRCIATMSFPSRRGKEPAMPSFAARPATSPRHAQPRRRHPDLREEPRLSWHQSQ